MFIEDVAVLQGRLKTGETLPESALMTDYYSWSTTAYGSFGAIPQGQLRFSNPVIQTTSSSKNERSCELNERCIQLPSQLSGTASITAIPGHYLDISQTQGCADFSCMQKKTDHLTAISGGVSFMIGAPIPEPSTIALTFSGMIAAFAIAARQRKPASKNGGKKMATRHINTA
ncbi:PEP-CTERM sorting domain-containing protein [Aquabacterium parvum]|uniref:PEP-CTERM sorting domain-containing protein n=1 Tax=Aquabacterium parvum TaxID=70584 RepID=UPI0009F92D5C|nr:PEP-CTERM sorting domain-containing protein [Aquabacterium parvum]